MANAKTNNAAGKTTLKKADVLLRNQQEIAARQSALMSQSEALGTRIHSIEQAFNKKSDSDVYIMRQSSEIYEKLTEENKALKQEILYLAKQNENIFGILEEKLSALDKRLEELATLPRAAEEQTETSETNGQPEQPEVDETAVCEEQEPLPAPQEIDYEKLSDMVAEKLAARINDIDYDRIAGIVAERQGGIDYDRIAALIPVPAEAQAAPQTEVPQAAEIDYDRLAAMMNMQEVISPDYIAAKVAEQIVVPACCAPEIDTEEIARRIAEKIEVPAAVAAENVVIDEETLAQRIAEKLTAAAPLPLEELTRGGSGEQTVMEELYEQPAEQPAEEPAPEETEAAAEEPAAAAIDIDELADALAVKLGALRGEDFDIIVDEEGCRTISDAIFKNVDMDSVVATVSEQLRATVYEVLDGREYELDYDEIVKRLADRLVMPALNEDALADKAAAVLSNYLPDGDELVDKITANVAETVASIPVADSETVADTVTERIKDVVAQQPVIDNELIIDSISERLIEKQAENDYDIVIDEEGITRITDLVVEKFAPSANERLDRVESDIAEIKAMLLAGAVVAAETGVSSAAEEPLQEPAEGDIALVTVSDLVEDSEGEPAEVVEEIDEELSSGEIMPDGIPGISGGVDFGNMMKYNRSFIARIIQSTDDQKNYYGQVKQSLLSYKKVNSNIAWGAERFNKGRETIARFKIRGKTLCLYLALDPAEHAYTVYHHADVSDNKSMHGTPMMVKIKSPLGARKAIRLIDEMLAARNGEKRSVPERDYAAMYPYESIEELIEDGFVKDVSKNK